MAVEHYGHGRVREALRIQHKAVSLDPTFVQAYLGLAACLKQLGLEAQAREAYRKAVELCPALVEAGK